MCRICTHGFGEVLDTSFGRLRIQLSAVFFKIISLLSPVFLPFFSPGFTHRLLRGRRFAVPEVERFPLDMWVATVYSGPIILSRLLYLK